MIDLSNHGICATLIFIYTYHLLSLTLVNVWHDLINYAKIRKANVVMWCVYWRPTFWSIIKKGSTESFSSFPYVCTLLSNMLWLYYGILDSSGILLITIGTSGCAFQTFYLSVYLTYAANSKDRVNPLFLIKIEKIIMSNY